MTVKVGINGFGRIGRQVFKAITEKYGEELEIVAVNDLMPVDVNAHLLEFDTNYGHYDADISVVDGNLVVNGKVIETLAERDPGVLPWGKLGVDIVIESTGVFRDKLGSNGKPGAEDHITRGGAKKVIISAPAKNEDITIVLGVNDEMYNPAKHNVISNASCTTNCLAPAAKVVHDNFTIKRGLMTTIHSYTSDQRILDFGHKDMRRSRAAACNIIPTTTGAAKAVALVIPDLKGKFDGIAIRVPTPTVSIVDFVAEIEKPTSVEELNALFKEASEGALTGILGYETRPLVSMDFKGDERSSIIDAANTKVLSGTMVKVLAWYDNEWGYSCRMADLSMKIAKSL